jgi:hypothetical protein
MTNAFLQNIVAELQAFGVAAAMPDNAGWSQTFAFLKLEAISPRHLR